MMTNTEIQELIASYSTIANEPGYSDNTRAAARRKTSNWKVNCNLRNQRHLRLRVLVNGLNNKNNENSSRMVDRGNA
jgi:hypothetical protein